MSRTVRIIEPGMYTTVQDAGRPGFLRYGLPPSGAMDLNAFDAANGLLCNAPTAAVLEATCTTPVLEFSHPTRVAIVYANHSRTFEAQAHERISFDPINDGYRAYIAFDGGIDVPVVMGSCSTYVPGKLGGFEGRILRAGDVLRLAHVGGASSSVREESMRFVQFNEAGSSVYGVRIIPGPEAGWFDCGGLNTFLTEPFVVSAQSNRTGLRLEGPALSFRSDSQMVSAGIAFGTVQVPPSGLPIIMMADHPTTGGYPRIGMVVADDLPVLAQLRPGDQVRFREVYLGRYSCTS